MKTTYWMFLGLVLAGPAAFAAEPPVGLFVEPSLSYELGSSEVNYPSPLGSSSAGDVNGLGIGARLGFHFSEILFVGIDGRYSLSGYVDDLANYDASSHSFNWGPVVGVQMPVAGLRVWGAYILGGMRDPDASAGFDVKFAGLSGYRLGAGVQVAPVSINLEYQDLSYGKTTLEAVGPFSTGADFDSVELGISSWILSVSLPITL